MKKLLLIMLIVACLFGGISVSAAPTDGTVSTNVVKDPGGGGGR